MEFTQEQHEVLIGGLLGDLSIEGFKRKFRSNNARFKIERSIKDLKYLEWQHNLFKECCGDIHIYNRYDKRYDKKYESCYLRSWALPELNSYYNDWYQPKKIIPRNFELTPLILAIWFADDGCCTKYSENHYCMKFSTECFLPEETEYLIWLLVKITNEKFSCYRKYPNKDQFIIKGSSGPANSVMNIIKDILPKIGMERKVKNIKEYHPKYVKIFEYIKDHPWSLKKELNHLYEKNATKNILDKAEQIGIVEKRKYSLDERQSQFKLTIKGEEYLDKKDIQFLKRNQ
jgi:hypothetical protein